MPGLSALVYFPPGQMPSPQNSARAMAQAANEMTVVYFTASILALVTIIITAHFISIILLSFDQKKRPLLGKRFFVVMRFFRSGLLCRVPFFGSVGHALIFATYIMINIALLLQNIDLSLSVYWAKRMGWITTCNIALITFLALKNTPLAFLTPYSYERLNILHQAAGCCTIFFAILHAVLWIGTDAKKGSLQKLLELENIMGMVAGFAMLTTFTTVLTLKPFRYEVFYIVHLVMFLLIIISVGMHRPMLHTKSIYIIIFAACIWFSDRLLRGVKIVCYSLSNRAIIYPLPQGGVHIIMRRTPWRATPGTHVFLWIPRIRAIETHPFTIVSTNPLELVVSPQDGFTRDLSSLAFKTPGAVLRASCDGPYGTLPDFAKFDHVVLIAGGSGATFMFGIALNLIRKMASTGAKPVIHFVWVIRDAEMQSWFEKELAELSVPSFVTLAIYVTRTIIASQNTEQGSNEIVHEIQNFEKSCTDPEKSASGNCSPSTPAMTLPVRLGRPDINAIIRSIASGTEEQERTIVAACGPKGLMRETCDVVGDLVVHSGRSVTLHCEHFGW
ncbi:hypothetical protein EG329_008629 [Mollisiaceae sp. DMI_Dod_QoI]|nr:hypothetical protein EG329_008629 [Helotiales sp. DMI_Dod_QoI]